MADAKRIVFGSNIIPYDEVSREEFATVYGGNRRRELAESHNLGGEGTVSIDNDQGGEDWISCGHHSQDYRQIGDNWETMSRGWLPYINVTGTSAHAFGPGGGDLEFLYIKNLGGQNGDELYLSLNGSTGNYYIIIPAHGSVSLRGDGTDLHGSDLRVKCGIGGSTTMEYIMARET